MPACPHHGCTCGPPDRTHRLRTNGPVVVAWSRSACVCLTSGEGLLGTGICAQLTTSARRDAAEPDVNPLTAMPGKAAPAGEGVEGEKGFEEVVQMAPICNSKEGPGKARAFLRNAPISPRKMKDACDLVRRYPPVLRLERARVCEP